MEEIGRHNKPDDLWLVVDNRVYDVSKWAKHHPGGHLCMENVAGADATDAFENYHPAYVQPPGLVVFRQWLFGVVGLLYCALTTHLDRLCWLAGLTRCELFSSRRVHLPTAVERAVLVLVLVLRRCLARHWRRKLWSCSGRTIRFAAWLRVTRT